MVGSSAKNGSMEEMYAKISLADEEEDGMVIANTVAETLSMNFRWCLVGRFLTEKVINFNAMQHTLASLWRPVKVFCVKEINSTLFLFQFFHESDIKRVIEGGPWTFDQYLLLCKRLIEGEQPTRIELNESYLWVRVYGVPIRFMSERMGKEIGNYIETYAKPKHTGERIQSQWLRSGQATADEGQSSGADELGTGERSGGVEAPKMVEPIVAHDGEGKIHGEVSGGSKGKVVNVMRTVVLTQPSMSLKIAETGEVRKKGDFGGVVIVDAKHRRVDVDGGNVGAPAWPFNVKGMVQLIGFAQNYIDVEVQLEDMLRWRLTDFYGLPERSHRKESWNMLLPWCYIRDFNGICSISEKRDRVSRLSWMIDGFKSTLQDCGLEDFENGRV